MSLDVFQQVFTLSLTSNLANYSQGTEEDLQKDLQNVLPFTFPGTGWELVWGPVVVKHLNPEDPTTGPDNSWYVAYHPRLVFEDGSVHPTYVITIAGTPPDAPHVWETQNLAVNSVANFNLWVANGITNAPQVVKIKDIVAGTPYIATGIVNTVHLLLTRPAPAGAVSAGTRLVDFIAKVNQSGSAKFIFTGHSLGGALSPSLALALASSETITPSSVLTYPTAGPSPGNAGFAGLFAATFPARKKEGGSTYQVWNLNLINRLDIVPQAWTTIKAVSPEQTLLNIPTIYGKPAVPLVQGLALLLILQASRSGVIYLPLPSQPFTGTPPSTAPKDIGEFLEIALKEHERPYFALLGITVPGSQVLSGGGVTEKPELEKRWNYPVIADFEWARRHPKEVEEEVKKVEGTEEAKEVFGS